VLAHMANLLMWQTGLYSEMTMANWRIWQTGIWQTDYGKLEIGKTTSYY